MLWCRATKPIWGKGRGELVWLTQPEGYFNKHTQQQQQQHHQNQQQPQHNHHQPHQSPQQQQQHGWLSGAAGRVASFLRGDGGKAQTFTNGGDGGIAPESGPSPFSSTSSTGSSPPLFSHVPWEETVLAEGPDVMFEVVDLNPQDDQLEVVSDMLLMLMMILVLLLLGFWLWLIVLQLWLWLLLVLIHFLTYIYWLIF